MTISPLSGSGGIDEVWGDMSGGSIVVAIQHPTYLSKHDIRVIPFDTVGTAIYTSAPGGSTSSVLQDMDNLVTLLAACYGSDTTVTPTFVLQTLSDHTGQVPYNSSFTFTASAVGTDGATSLSPVEWTILQSRGGDGSKWRLVLPGISTALGPITPAKLAFGSIGGPVGALINYITGVSNGPVHAVKSNIVTHNGVPVAKGPGNATAVFSKRLRRRFGLI